MREDGNNVPEILNIKFAGSVLNTVSLQSEVEEEELIVVLKIFGVSL